MPYVSNAQRRAFHAKEDAGEISHATVAHWDAASKGKKLPERVRRKKSCNTDNNPGGILKAGDNPLEDVGRLAMTEEAVRLHKETSPPKKSKRQARKAAAPVNSSSRKDNAMSLSKQAALTKMAAYLRYLAGQMPTGTKVAETRARVQACDRLRKVAELLPRTGNLIHTVDVVYADKTAAQRHQIVDHLVRGFSQKLAKAMGKEALGKALGLGATSHPSASAVTGNAGSATVSMAPPAPGAGAGPAVSRAPAGGVV